LPSLLLQWPIGLSGCSTSNQSAETGTAAHKVKSASVKKTVKPVKTAKAEPAKMPAANKAADAMLTASIAPEAAPIVGRTWNYEYGLARHHHLQCGRRRQRGQLLLRRGREFFGFGVLQF
jgi:hypothetical protein